MPPSWPPQSSVDLLNARFGASVYDADWSTNTLPDAGILFHVIDGWEDQGALYLPAFKDISASFLFQAQRENGAPLTFHTFNGIMNGLILRPGVTKVKCASSKDSNGKCGADSRSGQAIGGALREWTKQQTAWRQTFYNEFIVDKEPWMEDPVGTVEAFINLCGLQKAFIERYQVNSSRFPCVTIKPDDWDAPFQLAPSDAWL